MSELISNIHWQHPWWLLLSLQPLLLWFVINRMQKQTQQLFADSHLLADILVNSTNNHKTLLQRIFSRDITYGLAMALLSLSLASPQIADNPDKHQRQVIRDIMLVVDVSRSMQATDILPNRLRRTLLETYEFLSFAKNARIGVIVYAGRPHLLAPLTTDINALKFYLQDLESIILPTQGSDATAALALARSEMKTLQEKQSHQLIRIWLTDGDIELTQINSLKTEIRPVSEYKISTYILGLGTSEGAAIPLTDGSWLESEGQGVISKMNIPLLQQLATLGSGKFSPVRDNEADWETLYFQGVLKNQSSEKNAGETSSPHQHWKQLYGWFLFPALVFLVVTLFPLSRQSLGKFFKRPSIRVLVLLLTLSFLHLSAVYHPAYANDTNKKNNASSHPDNNYNTILLKGINAYKASDFSKSQAHFIQAVLDADTDNKRAIALHNLGNVLFQLGNYQQASFIFRDALQYNPEQQQTIKNQQLTLVLSNLMAEQLTKNNSNNELLSNPANNNSPSSLLLDLPDHLPFMLNSTAVNKLNDSLSSLPKLNKEEWASLLNKGMAHLKLMGNSSKPLHPKELNHKQNVELARVHLLNLQEQSSNNLWKRLFEIEEGFPSKLKQPKERPGIKSW